MSANRIKGFTLLELAISVAIMAVLLVSTFVGARAYLQMGRERRTTADMRALSTTARDLAIRGLTSQVMGTVNYQNYATYDDISVATLSTAVRSFGGIDLAAESVCFDLGTKTPTCSAAGVPVPCFGPAGTRARDETATEALDGLLGPLAATGFSGINVYGRPYGLCIRSRRVEVHTCLPIDEVPAELATDPCPYLCPTGLVCRSTGVSLVPPNLAPLAFSYRAQYWGEATDLSGVSGGPPSPCNTVVTAGNNNPSVVTFGMGANSGFVSLYYETYTLKDRIWVTHPTGVVLADTGCVSSFGDTINFSFSGTSVVTVHVEPNCEHTSFTSTLWKYNLSCGS